MVALYGLDRGTVIVFKFEQPANASKPMVVTVLGITMFVKLVQPSNALFSISVTESGTTNVVPAYSLNE